MGSGAKISLFPLILAICVAVIIIFIVIVVVILTKKKKNTRINVNDDFINELIKYYGNKENINNITVDNGRLKITVSDIDTVDLNAIKEKSASGVFVTGNVIKTLYKLDSELICKEMKKRL